MKASQDLVALRTAVSAEYPTLCEDHVRHLCLMWAVVGAAYSDVAFHLSHPAAALDCPSRFNDNLAEALDFLNGPRLAFFVAYLPGAECEILRETIARDLGLSVHGTKSLIVLPDAYIERIEELEMEVACA